MSGIERQAQAREGRQTTRRPAAQRPATQSSAPRRRRKIDLDAVPDGYDPDVWDLVLFFHQQAEHYQCTLAAGRLITYAKLEDRLNKAHIRETKTFRGDLIVAWVPMVKAMMMDFWDDEVVVANTAFAIDQFCGFEMFESLLVNILDEHQRKTLSREMAERPKEDRPVSGPTPEGIRRRALRQQQAKQEEANRPVFPARKRRSWDEIRERVKQMRKGSE